MDKRIPIAIAVALLAGLAGLGSMAFIGIDSDPGPVDVEPTTVKKKPGGTIDNPTRHRRASERTPKPANQRSPDNTARPHPGSDAPIATDEDGNEFEPTTHAPDLDGIQDAIDERMPELTACYETHLAHQPEANGKLVMAMQLAPEGTATKIAGVNIAASDMDATMMEGCIATVFEELRFDIVGQPTVVTMPLVFSTD